MSAFPYNVAMRRFVLIAVLAGCSHKSAPTTDWCLSYLNDFRSRAAADVAALGDATRREDLLAMVGSDPAHTIAFDVCSDADEDTPERHEARKQHVIDLQKSVTLYVLSHAVANPTELQALVTQVANMYTDPFPVKP